MSTTFFSLLSFPNIWKTLESPVILSSCQGSGSTMTWSPGVIATSRCLSGCVFHRRVGCWGDGAICKNHGDFSGKTLILYNLIPTIYRFSDDSWEIHDFCSHLKVESWCSHLILKIRMVWAVFADDTADCCPSDSTTISNLPEPPHVQLIFRLKASWILVMLQPCTGHYGSLQLPGLRHWFGRPQH